VKMPKSTVIHSDHQRKFPVRVGNITDYLDALGLIRLLQERELVKAGTVEQAQQQSGTERKPLPNEDASMITKALVSKDSTVRIESLKDLSTLPYRYILLEEGPLADTIGKVLASTDDAELSLVLDVLRAVANVGSDKEKTIVKAWTPRIIESAIALKSPVLGQKAIDVLQFIKSGSAIDVLVKWIREADDSYYSGLQITNVLANFGWFGLKDKARGTIYELLEKSPDERTKKRLLEALELLRRSGW